MKIMALLLTGCAGLLAQTEPTIDYFAGLRVTGQPFSATAVSRTVRTLEDGSHIDRTTAIKILRDDQGRQRREIADGKEVIITDPVASVHYVIANNMAKRTPMGPEAVEREKQPARDISLLERTREDMRLTPNTTIEDLGVSLIEGVSCQGVRITTMIPVGLIGNDHDLKSITERWYTNALHVMVKTSTTDPRSGASTYQLINIVRSAPNPALFQLPLEYKALTDTTLIGPAKKE